VVSVVGEGTEFGRGPALGDVCRRMAWRLDGAEPDFDRFIRAAEVRLRPTSRFTGSPLKLPAALSGHYSGFAHLCNVSVRIAEFVKNRVGVAVATGSRPNLGPGPGGESWGRSGLREAFPLDERSPFP
jgi:hypothetical protein